MRTTTAEPHDAIPAPDPDLVAALRAALQGMNPPPIADLDPPLLAAIRAAVADERHSAPRVTIHNSNHGAPSHAARPHTAPRPAALGPRRTHQSFWMHVLLAVTTCGIGNYFYDRLR